MELLSNIRELDACPDCLRKIREGFHTPVMYLPTHNALNNAAANGELDGCDGCLKLVIELMRAKKI